MKGTLLTLALLGLASVGARHLEVVRSIDASSMLTETGGQTRMTCYVGYANCCSAAIPCYYGSSSSYPCNFVGSSPCSFGTNTAGRHDWCTGAPFDCIGEWDDPYGCGWANKCAIVPGYGCNCNACTIDHGWPCRTCKACHLR